MANRYLNLKWLVVALLMAGCMFVLTHIPQEALPAVLQEKAIDKVEHVLADGLLTVFFVLSLKERTRFAYLLVILISLAAFGVVDEMTQPLVNRVASPIDWLANVLGITIVLLTFVCVDRLKLQALVNTDER